MTGARHYAKQNERERRAAAAEALLPKQPERLPDDPRVEVTRLDDDHYSIGVGDKFLKLSTFNAWRVFGMLSVMLGLKLPRAMAERIKL